MLCPSALARHEEERAPRRKRMLTRLTFSLLRLDQAVNTEIPRLETQLSSTEATLADTKSSLSSAEEQVSDLSSALADLEQRLADETDRLEGEIEEQKRHLADARKEVEKERTEKRRVVGLLAQTRASETALKEEVEMCVRDEHFSCFLPFQKKMLMTGLAHLCTAFPPT